MHLILDGYECPKEKLNDLGLVYSFLDSFPAKIKMTKIAPPQVIRYVGKKQQDWGITGVVLIAESHISIHTFPERNFFCLDVFSCNIFDSKKTIEFIKEYFQPGKLNNILHKDRLIL